MNAVHAAPMPPSPENLRTLRAESGMSQTEMAKRLHLSGPSRISDWECGKYPIDPARWELLLIVLGEHPDFKRSHK